MVKINKIIRSNPVSSFQQGDPSGGTAFAALAEIIKVADERLKPVAQDILNKRAEDAGLSAAKDSYGGMEITRPVGGGGGDDGLDGGDGLAGFNESLARTESGGRYGVVNSEGFTGKYQFGEDRLTDYRRATGAKFTIDEFRQNPALQETVQAWHIRDIDARLAKHVGKTAGGLSLSQNALRAMAHLGGVGGAEKFVMSDGKYDPADSNGTRLSDYAKTHGGDAGAGQRPEVTIRMTNGNLEKRLFSPFAGPMLQKANAVGKIAYLSQVLLQADQDMRQLANAFDGDSEGFQQAATTYVDKMVEAAPDMLRNDIRMTVGKEVARYAMGIEEARQTQVRQRALNSTTALAERRSDAYQEALVSGSPEDVAEARGQLEEILRTREALPGSTWTPEQTANVFIRAEQVAVAQREAGQRKQDAELKSRLESALDAAKEFRFSNDDAIAISPEAQAKYPELAQELRGHQALRDAMPQLQTMTPDAIDQVVETMRAAPVEEFAIDVVNAAAQVAKNSRRAWEEDPWAQAEKVMPIKPPKLGDPTDPQAFVQSLAEIRAYGNDLVDLGFVQAPVYFLKATTRDLQKMLSRDVPPEIRIATLAAFSAGMGEDAIRAIGEVGGDATTVYAGQFMAATGDDNLPIEVLRGQMLIDEKRVRPMPKSKIEGVFQTDFEDAFMGLPPGAEDQISGAAQALLAARIGERDLDDAAVAPIIRQAIQDAAGQSVGKNDAVRGGVQEVIGQPTLLPPTASGDEVTAALLASVGSAARRVSSGWFGFVGSAFSDMADAVAGRQRAINGEAWDAASGGKGVPHIHRQPIKASDIESGAVRILAAGPSGYKMEVVATDSGNSYDVTDADGNPYFFDLEKLVEFYR